jgi:hypothetical protein
MNTEPQAIPIIRDVVDTQAIMAVLDAALALQVQCPSFALLPSARDFAAVTAAVRQWASVHPEVTLKEWGQWSRKPTGDDPGLWIEGVSLEARWAVLTLHTPHELVSRRTVFAAVDQAVQP